MDVKGVVAEHYLMAKTVLNVQNFFQTCRVKVCVCK